MATVRPTIEIYTMASVAPAPASEPAVITSLPVISPNVAQIIQNIRSSGDLFVNSPKQVQQTYPQTLSTKDRLYFTFKEKIGSTSGRNKTRYLNITYNELKRRNSVPDQVRDHFHPLHVLSLRWWNLTHHYIYHYKDVETLVKLIVDLEAFPF